MLDFFKKRFLTPASGSDSSKAEKASWLEGLKGHLHRTRAIFSTGLSHLLLGKKSIDAELLEELETLLLSADVGLPACKAMIQTLTQQLERGALRDPEAIRPVLKTILTEWLRQVEAPLSLPTETKPFVILMVGINGAGKTTTIGKLAKAFQAEGKSVLLAAGDTFRAAAVEQLQTWGERNHIPVVAQQTGADSASVIFDAFQAAIARKTDILIADTAGRLHTQDLLMEELRKIIRVLRKQDETAPHEVLLVLDAGTGQNALIQAQKFHEALKVTGLVLTKLDGTAKGGIIFNIAKTLNIPIRWIGLGEGIDDLHVFKAEAFVEALFSQT